MKKLTLLFLLFISISEARYRHVPHEWNTNALCLSNNFWSATASWYYVDWLGAYYQTENWWIYHCDKGWLYPESDGQKGVWFYWQISESWVWTNEDTYPWAYDASAGKWFDFCVKHEAKIVASID